MPEIVVDPYRSVGPVRFDMTQKEVLDAIGPPSSTFLRNGNVVEWYYSEPHIEVVFDDQKRVELVAFFSGTVAVVKGVRLEGLMNDVVSALSDRGFSVRDNVIPTIHGPIPSGAKIADELGVTLGRETVDQPDIDNVNAFRRGYWDAFEKGESR